MIARWYQRPPAAWVLGQVRVREWQMKKFSLEISRDDGDMDRKYAEIYSNYAAGTSLRVISEGFHLNKGD